MFLFIVIITHYVTHIYFYCKKRSLNATFLDTYFYASNVEILSLSELTIHPKT